MVGFLPQKLGNHQPVYDIRQGRARRSLLEKKNHHYIQRLLNTTYYSSVHLYMS
jgi:hypothetical protein